MTDNHESENPEMNFYDRVFLTRLAITPEPDFRCPACRKAVVQPEDWTLPWFWCWLSHRDKELCDCYPGSWNTERRP